MWSLCKNLSVMLRKMPHVFCLCENMKKENKKNEKVIQDFDNSITTYLYQLIANIFGIIFLYWSKIRLLIHTRFCLSVHFFIVKIHFYLKDKRNGTELFVLCWRYSYSQGKKSLLSLIFHFHHLVEKTPLLHYYM